MCIRDRLTLSTQTLSGIKNANICQNIASKNIPENSLAEIPCQTSPKNFLKISPKPAKTGRLITIESRINNIRIKINKKS